MRVERKKGHDIFDEISMNPKALAYIEILIV